MVPLLERGPWLGLGSQLPAKLCAGRPHRTPLRRRPARVHHVECVPAHVVSDIVPL